MLVELNVMEQRYQAVLAVVQDGWQVAEVARRLSVSRQSVHAWISRYEQGGLAALLRASSHNERTSRITRWGVASRRTTEGNAGR